LTWPIIAHDPEIGFYGITDRAVIEKIIERDAGKPLMLDAPIPEA
jgi:hypothetical protein